jgi:hypothetical protein
MTEVDKAILFGFLFGVIIGIFVGLVGHKTFFSQPLPMQIIEIPPGTTKIGVSIVSGGEQVKK